MMNQTRSVLRIRKQTVITVFPSNKHWKIGTNNRLEPATILLSMFDHLWYN